MAETKVAGVARVAVGKPGLGKLLVKAWTCRELYLISLPALAFVLIFNYIPMYGITIAFRKINWDIGPYLSPMVKPLFANFWLMKQSMFWEVFKNTVLIATLKFVTFWPMPIILAILLNEVRVNAFKRVVQTISYLPHFISWVILSAVIYKLVDKFGPFNELRALLGMERVNLMMDAGAFLPIVVVSAILKDMGWGAIIYLAALAGVNPELYEAATIDGAGRWARIRYINLPEMLPSISILFLMSLPSLINAGFDQIYNLANPMVMKYADIMDLLILRMGLQQGQYELAAALGLFNGVLSLVLVVASNRLARRSTGYSLW